MRPSRLEAFSDGVMAVAITLLVFNLHVPSVPGAHLGRALVHAWPTYLAYLVSFVQIGITWVNHHSIFMEVRFADRTLLFDNIFLLFGVVTVPFSTSLAATWIRSGNGAGLAVAIYCATWVFVSLMFTLSLSHLVRHQHLLKEDRIDGLRLMRRKGYAGLVVYGSAGLVAVFDPILAILICLVFSLYYVVGVRSDPSTDSP